MRKAFYIRHGSKYVKINLQDIVYIEACGNYLKLVLPDNVYLVHLAMKKMEDELPPCLFFRVHRSYMVALDKVMAFKRDRVYLPGGIILPVSEEYKNEFKNQFWIIDRDSIKQATSFYMQQASSSDVF